MYIPPSELSSWGQFHQWTAWSVREYIYIYIYKFIIGFNIFKESFPIVSDGFRLQTLDPTSFHQGAKVVNRHQPGRSGSPPCLATAHHDLLQTSQHNDIYILSQFGDASTQRSIPPTSWSSQLSIKNQAYQGLPRPARIEINQNSSKLAIFQWHPMASNGLSPKKSKRGSPSQRDPAPVALPPSALGIHLTGMAAGGTTRGPASIPRVIARLVLSEGAKPQNHCDAFQFFLASAIKITADPPAEPSVMSVWKTWYPLVN